jgi:hypothetical protein
MPRSAPASATASPRAARLPTPAERAAQLDAAHRAWSRRRRWRVLLQITGCLGSAIAGLFLIGLGVHVTDEGTGRIAFWSGLLVGNGGILATLLASYLHADRTGDL